MHRITFLATWRGFVLSCLFLASLFITYSANATDNHMLRRGMQFEELLQDKAAPRPEASAGEVARASLANEVSVPLFLAAGNNLTIGMSSCLPSVSASLDNGPWVEFKTNNNLNTFVMQQKISQGEHVLKLQTKTKQTQSSAGMPFQSKKVKKLKKQIKKLKKQIKKAEGKKKKALKKKLKKLLKKLKALKSIGKTGSVCQTVDLDRVDLQRADKMPKMASEVSADEMKKGGQKYRNTFFSNFSGLTPANEFKMNITQPNEYGFDFSKADEAIKFAKERNLPVRGHTLIYHNQLPNWVTNRLFPYNKEQLKSVLANRINTMMKHYKGRVDRWDVLNEAFEPTTGEMSRDIFLNTIGPEYVDFLFQTARKADPDARLVYNDAGIEKVGKHQDGVYNMLKSMKQRGIPVDTIGFESHLPSVHAAKDRELNTTFSRFAKLGLNIEVTEADVTMDGPATAQKIDTQTKTYARLADACWQWASCDRFTVWGVTDAYSWLGPDAHPLLFDENYVAKPALKAVKQALHLQ